MDIIEIITIVSPNLTFKNNLVLDLGGVRCIVKHVGGDHSQDSSIVFVEEEKVLFLGDCLYPSVYSEQPQYKKKNIKRVLKNIEMFNADYYLIT